jgi:hypothetical protein
LRRPESDPKCAMRPPMSKGRKKPKLRDLSVNPLTYEEQTALIDAVAAAAHPINSAILGAVLVEHELDTSLRKRMNITDDEEWEKIVAESGPLNSFSRKIVLGRTLRIYSDDTRENLDIVRSVRNAFAHSRRIIDFSHHLVCKELDSIKVPKGGTKTYGSVIKYPPQQRYVRLCFLLAGELMRKRTSAYERSRKRYARKSSPVYQAIAPTLGLGATGWGGPVPGVGHAQVGLPVLGLDPPRSPFDIASPSQGSQLALLSTLFQEPPKSDDKTGK